MRNTGKKCQNSWYYLLSKISSPKLYRYEDIPLKLFIEIAKSGDYRRLVISGVETEEKLVMAFENIIKKNAEASNSLQYNSYFQLLKSYAKCIAEYTIIKSTLLKLTVAIDFKAVKEMRKRGYLVSLKNSEEYARCLTAGLKKVDNLITRAVMKKKEIERLYADKGEIQSFENILAGLSYKLGFQLQPDLTLAAYNEYKKMIKTEKNG